ncbi:ribosomal protection-like ABC-F family protein [Alkalihalobacillus pseudalcaliphilus]|uniref:ribosomal protection-like ABC-F family protein n=1 Tax=Alkalihalobacillus pseudalcaliphilus TaxID=79884 RepID=UPI00064DB193|nr:ABC-F type ribosomal protection protein [Alkalihalobacillus pseudalcaliphilus]KMK77563.1 elongation factor 3 [Alkalihalobacillus pseudalcaliphilus]
MIELLKMNQVQVEFQERVLFKNIHVAIKKGSVIGLIGRNGSGKSTLLKLINGDMMPTSGVIEPLIDSLAITTVEQEQANFEINVNEPDEMEQLKKWGIPLVHYQHLSGGEKLKVRLIEGFAKQSDLLLLDEPTNHLDQEGLTKLQNQIRHYQGSVIVISHDRAFLDDVVDTIWAIEDTTLHEHEGNYSSYIKAKEQQRLHQQQEFDKQQRKIKQINQQIHTLGNWSASGHAQSTKKGGFKEYYRVKAKKKDKQIKSKKRRLEAELAKNKVEAVKEEHQVQFSLQMDHKLGKRFLEINQLEKWFTDTQLFSAEHFTINHGEKVALTGKNGSGKSTLLKIIMGEDSSYTGNLWISPAAKVGYLSQDVFDLPLNSSPKDLFAPTSSSAQEKVRHIIKQLGFTAAQWQQPIREMSMGERVKCKLMKYLLEEKDVLILDEPTNHLDLPSREQFEETLSHYRGTLIVVSHDRYFLEKTTQIELKFEQGHLVKKLTKEPIQQLDNVEEVRMQLETEKQEVLGKLSFLPSNHPDYQKLDLRFKEIIKHIKEL